MDINSWRADVILHKLQIYLSGFDLPFFLNLLPYITLGLSFVLFLHLLRKFLILKDLMNQKPVFLEITPPASVSKTAYTTSKLFSVIHDLGERKTFLDKLLGRKITYSFEIVSTKQGGIRYIIKTTLYQAGNIKRNLISYLPQVSVKTVGEYLPDDLTGKHLKIIEFKLRKHFAYPLQKQTSLGEHDPVAYITGMMTQLAEDELVSLQMVLSPTRVRKTDIIKNKILQSEDTLGYLDRKNLPFPLNLALILLMLSAKAVTAIIGFVAWGITDFMNNGRTRNLEDGMLVQKKERVLNTFEKEAVEQVAGKISQPLFETSIRLLLLVNNKKELKERSFGFVSSLGTFSVPKYQGLSIKFNFFPPLVNKIRYFAFTKRLVSFTGISLLSVSEVSDLYHFPYQRVTQTENIVKTHSKELPAPLSLKQGNLDIIFAKNTYGGVTTDIGLTRQEREKHMYIIGATGAGKTTMILSMAEADIRDGRGVCVIDPHGDLAQTIINSIPKKRKNDFIYINPDDIKYPVGINLLETRKGLDEDELLREKELITESVVSLFRKIFSEVWSAHAHRLEYILRNTIQTALTMENPTIFTVYELLTNPSVQKSVLPYLRDENLKNFWKYEFGKAGDFQKVKMIGPITSRVGRFLFSPSARRMLEQKHSTIDFDEVLDKGKILICNLSKGNLGEDNTEVMGIMILAKLQLSALRRAKTEQRKRKPFYLYVDEFQTFATPSFVQMLSEARKYKVFLTMAEQSTSQQKDRNLVNVILANVGTVVSFKSANPEDEKLMLPQFEPYVEKGEIANLPRYRFYMKVSADNPQEPFSGETILTDVKADKKKKEELIAASRKNYAIEYKHPPAPEKAKGQKKQEEIKEEETVTSGGMPEFETA